MDPYRLLVALHGYLGVLVVAALLHPAIRLRRGPPSRGDRWSIALTSGVLLLGAILSVWVYPTYRNTVKRELLTRHLEVALLFERKEHLGFFVVVLGLLGAVLGWSGADPRAARLAYALAAILGTLVVGAGTVVGAFHG